MIANSRLKGQIFQVKNHAGSNKNKAVKNTVAKKENAPVFLKNVGLRFQIGKKLSQFHGIFRLDASSKYQAEFPATSGAFIKLLLFI